MRGEALSITVETQCEHCSDPMTLDIDSDMNVRVEQSGAEPLVFTPDVSVFDIEDANIVDDF